MVVRDIIDLRLTQHEAHMLLRALAQVPEHGLKEDQGPARWVAERLLRILAPELGSRPLDALMATEGREDD